MRRPAARLLRALPRLVWRAGVALSLAFALTAFGVTLLAWRPLDERRLPDRAPMIIVLGGGMAADGTLGYVTERRFDDAMALFTEGRAPRIHFSGGDIHRGVTEGALMAETARARLPDAGISFEDRSHSTLQNALFTVEALGEVPPGTLLVSDATHLFRAWLAFQWAGARGLVPVPSFGLDEIPPGDRSRRLLREAAAIWMNAGRVAVFGLRRLAGGDREALLPILAGGRGA